MNLKSEKIFIDSDNGLGSKSGDIDDAYAISAIIKSGREIAAISSVFGNVTEAEAYKNNIAISNLLGFSGNFLHGASSKNSQKSQTAEYLAQMNTPLRILALGPLTNIALAMQLNGALINTICEIIIVGGNMSTAGRWPPLWPFEFNLTKDKQATKYIFQSALNITLIPLDVAVQMRVGYLQLLKINGSLGEFFLQNSRRWFRRSFWLKGSKKVPLWDLTAAMYLLYPQLFSIQKINTNICDNAFLQFNQGNQKIQVVAGFNKDALWDLFLNTVNQNPSTVGH